MYDVLSPLGEPVAKVSRLAPRVSDLSGKTVCEVSNGQFMSHVSFPIIRELLQKRYSGIKIIPYTEFEDQRVDGSTEQILGRAETAVAQMAQGRCDAVITGNGG